MEQSTTTIATRWTIASLLPVLALMLAMVLATATPVLAQAGADQYDLDSSAGEVSATGTMEQFAAEPVVVDGIQICELSTHSITDETTGQYYDLKSDAVDLDAYAGQRVTVTGTSLPTPAIGGAGTERCPDLEVTSIVPAHVPDSGQPSEETVPVTFQLTIDGKVPEGRLLGVNFPLIADVATPVFCSTAAFDSELPRCEAGATYTDTFEAIIGSPLSYEYTVLDYDYGGVVETFAADTITPTEGTTLSVTYQADGTTGPPPDEESATFSFELAVECEPPAKARFFGQVPAEGTFSTPLTDPDSDGLYTGSITVPQFPPGPRPVPPDMEPVSLPVRITQGTGTAGPGGNHPGLPVHVIEDFGVVKAQDRTFESTVSFCDGGGSDQYSDGQYDQSSGVTDGKSSLENGTGLAQLPSTGGAMLLTVGAGALLVGGGLLIRKIFQ